MSHPPGVAPPPGALIRPPITYSFTSSDGLRQYAVPMRQWLATNDKRFHGLHASAVVFNASGTKALLLQRAAHDSMPGRWEPAGGAIDPGDETILQGCARELYEEAGLKAKRIVRQIGSGDPFTNRTGTHIFWRLAFEVEVEDTDDVTNDPNEHARWIWASQKEIEEERREEDGEEIPITTTRMKKTLLDAFHLKREAGEIQD
ncbi:NUDIX hydrolase domain-like protein [Emericellopsis atlantica]|uniref:NUDIX hydrolase domain-like protein n=1 Tax=Emericellopsis atlantica TaxID=2614577 RepID=A0A9P7ZER0_9HYPO|nr:NUDIX hydrolase domain-like protein [Emericellopsis atlantica]KAG9250734.1 NUDIX hydrolase domain-like protein [Emericellopsis atlantica]